MKRLAESILEETATLAEGTPITAKMLLRLGGRAALDQALSRLVRRGKLLRVGRGVYVAPVSGRFGTRAPSAQKVVEELSLRRGETIAPSGASAANALGLTTQVPTRMVYLTSGRSRKITLGKQIVHLQHAPAWQLTLAREPAGEIIRALAWAGPKRVNQALKEIETKVPQSEFQRISQQSSLLPMWMATALSRTARYA
jgi:hypothetical protein